MAAAPLVAAAAGGGGGCGDAWCDGRLLAGGGGVEMRARICSWSTRTPSLAAHESSAACGIGWAVCVRWRAR
eukprot:70672-Prymnesium_polylepis.1